MDYAGSELELFKHADNWKRYYAGIFSQYLTGDVLEVGAGIGETTKALCNGSQRSWLCVEPDPQLTAIIEKKKREGYLPEIVEVKTGFLNNIEPGRTFDVIMYIDVIEHIEDDAAELKRAFQRLKPGGKLIILVPAHNYLFTAFDKVIGHYRRYNKKMLLSAVPAQLKKIKLVYLDSVGLTASLANKLFLKQEYPKLKQIMFWNNFMVPLSTVADKLLFHTVGKTVVGIWQKEANTP